MIRWLVCTKAIRSTYGLGLHPSGEVRRSLMKSIQGQYRSTARQQHWGNPTWVKEEWLANPMKSSEIWPPCVTSQYGRLIVIFRYHTSHQNMAAAKQSRLHEYSIARVNEKQINFCMRQNMTKIMRNNENYHAEPFNMTRAGDGNLRFSLSWPNE